MYLIDQPHDFTDSPDLDDEDDEIDWDVEDDLQHTQKAGQSKQPGGKEEEVVEEVVQDNPKSDDPEPKEHAKRPKMKTEDADFFAKLSSMYEESLNSATERKVVTPQNEQDKERSEVEKALEESNQFIDDKTVVEEKSPISDANVDSETPDDAQLFEFEDEEELKAEREQNKSEEPEEVLDGAYLWHTVVLLLSPNKLCFIQTFSSTTWNWIAVVYRSLTFPGKCIFLLCQKKFV